MPQTSVSLPAPDDREGWRTHWQTQGQPWRTELEIDQKRQAELDQRRAIAPNIEKGIYPFKDMKLTRADVEWLLATHENGRGPVDWSDEKQRGREGLDLRGAYLDQVDLSDLPLARLQGGLARIEWDHYGLSEYQRNNAGVFMQGTLLRGAQLQGAEFYRAHLESADLSRAQLQEAECRSASLKGAILREANLEGAYLIAANLEGAFLMRANLKGVHLEKANLVRVVLKWSKLGDEKGIGPRLADIDWGNTNLAVVDWGLVKTLGDEYEACQRKKKDGTIKDRQTQIKGYHAAVRANRQLAMVLQSQGISEEAVRFAYRAQVLQKHVFFHQMLEPRTKIRQKVRTLGIWLFSWFLFLIAGYGYRPGRSFLAYLLIITGFAIAYYVLGHTAGPLLSPLGAFVFSMTSFHGRGFFPGNNISLDGPLTVLAALEALVGLIIEVTFIATLTQRFFNR